MTAANLDQLHCTPVFRDAGKEAKRGFYTYLCIKYTRLYCILFEMMLTESPHEAMPSSSAANELLGGVKIELLRCVHGTKSLVP